MAFWFDGYGAVLLACMVIAIGWVLLEFHADRDALEKRRRGMDAEILAAAKNLADKQRPDLQAAIRASVERDFAEYARYQADKESRLSKLQWELDSEQQKLEVEKAKLLEARARITAWKDELVAVRRKAEVDKEKRQALKQRIRWAHDALTAEPPNPELALRHLKSAEKI